MMVSALAALALALQDAGWRDVEVDARPVTLSSRYDDGRIGALTFVGGVHLTSGDDDFGGFSGLRIRPDGSLLAVSDAGTWLSGSLERSEDGRLMGLSSARLAPILNAGGEVVSSKSNADAEALEFDGEDALVAYEHGHRIWRYAHSDGRYGFAEAFIMPPGLRRAPANGGLEAVARLADGRFLLLTEDQRDKDDLAIGWVGAPRAWTAIRYRPEKDFSPTDAVLSSDGETLYIVERAFSPTRGPRARIVRVTAADFDRAGVVEGEELALLAFGTPIDNFEGIAVAPGPDGTERLLILSDDNFSPAQRTLLLEFIPPTE